MRDGQVVYGCFCDDEGKVLDDGTVTRWSAERFRMTSADPTFQWLDRHSRRFDVQVEDVTTELAALALQGPSSRAILAEVCSEGIEELGYFRATETRFRRKKIEVSRTGYTGDLGYELWMPNEKALEVWDTLLEVGKQHGIEPLGLDALDVTRIEAGYILAGVDYFNSRFAPTEAQKSSPFELGLDWAVHLDRERFIGQDALREEKRRGPRERLVGLEIDWEETERLFEARGLPPALPAHAWRDGVPVYDGGAQVGRATSGAWSPRLKKNLALATVAARFAIPGTQLKIEVTVDYRRAKVRATVVERPFFNPERKRT
jgi:aminomethyltransferase